MYLINTFFKSRQSSARNLCLLVFTVLVLNACGGSDTKTPDPVPDLNSAPIVNAGANMSIEEGAMAQLMGTGSDAEGNVTFSWSQSSGTNVPLSDTSIANPTFSAPLVTQATTLTFTLTVTDSAGLTASDSVDVTVSDVTTPFSVDAGMDRTINEGDKAELVGLASGGDGMASLLWTQTMGAPQTLTNQDSAKASFTAADVAQDMRLEFTLTVTDSSGNMAVDTLAITVKDVPVVIAPPIVDAGTAYAVNPGGSVTLTGTGTDVNGDVRFSWLQTAGPAVALIGANMAQVSFIAPSVSDQTLLTFELTVTSSTGLSASDSADVTVSGEVIGSPVVYNRRIKTMRIDFDNNGIAESVTSFAYNSDGTLEVMNNIYTDDGAADAQFNAFPWGLPRVDEETVVTYNSAGLIESLYTTRDDLAYEFVYDWISSGKINTSISKNYDTAGQLVGQIDMTVNYTTADLVSTVEGVSVFPVSTDTQKLDYVLSYDGSGAVESNLQTITSVFNGVSYVQQTDRQYTWNADGRIGQIRELDPDPNRDYESNRHYTYTGERLVEIRNDTPRGLFVWDLSYDADGLLSSFSMDINDDDVIDANVELEWQDGTCVEQIVFGPGAAPNPNKGLDDDLPYTLADSHFTMMSCGLVK